MLCLALMDFSRFSVPYWQGTQFHFIGRPLTIILSITHVAICLSGEDDFDDFCIQKYNRQGRLDFGARVYLAMSAHAEQNPGFTPAKSRIAQLYINKQWLQSAGCSTTNNSATNSIDLSYLFRIVSKSQMTVISCFHFTHLFVITRLFLPGLVDSLCLFSFLQNNTSEIDKVSEFRAWPFVLSTFFIFDNGRHQG